MSDFSKTKLQFHLPKGMIYLDGNSLGPLPKKAQERIQHTLNKEWGEMLVTGWNKAGWMEQHQQRVPQDLASRKRIHRRQRSPRNTRRRQSRNRQEIHRSLRRHHRPPPE